MNQVVLFNKACMDVRDIQKSGSTNECNNTNFMSTLFLFSFFFPLDKKARFHRIILRKRIQEMSWASPQKTPES